MNVVGYVSDGYILCELKQSEYAKLILQQNVFSKNNENKKN